MSAPRPGFLRGFAATFTRALRTSLRGRRTAVLVAVLAVPPMLALLVREARHASDLLVSLVLFLFLQFLVPVVGLLFGTGVLADEASGGTLPYLFTRPAPRSSILLGKLAAAALLGGAAVSLSLGATLALLAGVPAPDGFAGRAFLASLLALPAYLAAFTMLSVLTRWGLLAGFLYAFGVEGAISLIPGMVKKITLLYYSRSLLGTWASDRVRVALVLGAEDGGASPEAAVAVLAGVTVAALGLSLGLVARKEFVATPAD